MAAEIKFVCSWTFLLGLQASLVSSKDDAGLVGCSSPAENLQRPGSLRDRFTELSGIKKGFSRQSWKTSVDENQQNNVLQDGDKNIQDGGWNSPNQKIWGKRRFGSETGQAEKRNLKLCEGEKRKWGRNNQKVWGKRGVTFLAEPDQLNWTILGAKLLNYGAGKELTNNDINFQLDGYKKLETDSESWSDGFNIPMEGKRKWGQNKAKVWGKRDVSQEEKRKWGKRDDLIKDEDKRKWGQSKAMVWGKRVDLIKDEEKRKWGQSKAMVWGKRDDLIKDEDKRKWGQSKAMVWGKRDDLITDEDKRKWGQSKAMVWGKRDDLIKDEEKRKWGQNKAMVWGKRDGLLIDEEKRKWGQNKAMVWGKRNGLMINSEKRKWGQNKAKVWGKREILEEDKEKLISGIEPVNHDINGEVKRKRNENKAEDLGKLDNQHEEKRKWGNNKAKVWGKRDETKELQRLGINKAKLWQEGDHFEEEKRKWGNNKAKVWGKRDTFENEKRKWGISKAKVWGKRQKQETIPLYSITKEPSNVLEKNKDRMEEEKRKWNQNKAKVWGKRDISSVSEKRKWGKNKAEVWGGDNSTNFSKEAQAKEISQANLQRHSSKEDYNGRQDGFMNLMKKLIMVGDRTKKICLRNKTITPCSQVEGNQIPNRNKDLPEIHHVIGNVAAHSDAQVTSHVTSLASDSSGIL